MTKQHNIDVEIRRLKNRVRQQRCRARKREEKSKTDAYALSGNHNACCGEKSLPIDLFVSCSSSMTSGLHTMEGYLDAESRQAKSMDGQLCEADECGEQFKTSSDFGDGCSTEIAKVEKGRTKFAVLGLPCMINGFSFHRHDRRPIRDGSMEGKSQKISQPFSQIEEVCSLNAFPIRECTSILDDVLARRLKNRERQRRYRERKRQELDITNAYLRSQSTYLQIQRVFKPETSVKCFRDWKKDARMAHNSEELTNASLGELNSENRVNPIDHEGNEATRGRRNWKTAARNKVE